MVNIKELRIGNIIAGKYHSIIQSISSIVKDISYSGEYCICLYNGDKYGIDYIEPIQLTEELLVKCGMNECDDACFVRYAYRNGKFKMNIMICGLKKYILSINDIENRCQICNVEVKYLHQLQNIYFDLTGKELEVNL